MSDGITVDTNSPRPRTADKLKVFVSYSRKDDAFARDLVAGLALTGFEPFFDQHDIAPGEEWELRLGRLIEMADTVVFVVTENSVVSKHCLWEGRRTLQASKRLIPVVAGAVEQTSVPDELKRLNFIYFDKPNSFAASLTILTTALRSNLEWIRQHTHWADSAQRWESAARAEAYLIRGDELVAAQRWLAGQPRFAPEPALITRAFIAASETAELARQNEERKRLEEMAAAQREREAALQSEKKAMVEAESARLRTARLQRQRMWLAIAAAVVAAALGGFSYMQWRAVDLATQKLASAFKLAQRFSNAGVPWELGKLMNYATRFEDISLADINVLWLDDIPNNNVAERALLEGLGAKITCARHSADALQHIANDSVDLIISDFGRPGDACEGLCLLDTLRELSSAQRSRGVTQGAPRGARSPRDRARVVFYTGSCTEAQREAALKAGADEETNSPEHLITAIVKATRREDTKKPWALMLGHTEPICTDRVRAPTPSGAQHAFAGCVNSIGFDKSGVR